ncbi:MAG: dissimilatory sulfite reductase D family protein [Desulfobacteraceae bacterium]|uniref:dissimilatory sulfite reductase D family protein n=1 Tax=Desulfosalsimonas sp. TaxID=3073848 RepID=UPI003970CB51|nr:dissimilatory sulfite reductase D family protein [Desulfobacteraceae bacterium]
MALDYEECKQKVLDGIEKKSKSKSKFYFSDLAKMMDAKPREAKKIVTQMVEEGILVFWSSGSTSMYGLKGAGKQSAAEHED